MAILLLLLGSAWLFGESILGVCPTYRMLGVKKVGDKLSTANLYLIGIIGVQLALAYSWWHAGWEKITGDFVSNLGGTLTFFASENPYPKYVDFINSIALPNATSFGYIVEWSQLLVGIGLILSVIAILYLDKKWKKAGYIVSVIALLAGAVMNANFWFAAGWTGSGTAGSNVAMFWPSLVLAYVWIKKLENN